MEKTGDTLLNFTTTEAPPTCQVSQGSGHRQQPCFPRAQPEGRLTGEDTPDSPVGRASTTLASQEPVGGQAGEGFETGVGLQRDQDDILPGEGVQEDEEVLSAEEMAFLEEFPLVKGELEAGIRKLHALADHIDATHRTLARTNVVAGSMAVVSGAMSLLGLVLAPATAGGSLMFSAAGKGLGTAAGVTGILTHIWEHFRDQEARAQARSLVPTHGHEVGEPTGQNVSDLVAVGRMAWDYGSALEDIKKNIRAFRIARAHPRLATAAKRLLATGRVPARKSRQVQRAFKGTTLLMTVKVRLLGSAMAGLSLSQDLTALLKAWKELKEGARTKSAEELRARTRELEGMLTGLTQLYENLLRRKLLQEERPRGLRPSPLPPARRGEAGPRSGLSPGASEQNSPGQGGGGSDAWRPSSAEVHRGPAGAIS